MLVVHDPEPPAGLHDSAVAVGGFDGVHLGHRAVLDAARTAADGAGGPAVVVLDVRAGAPDQLTEHDQRLELLAAAGVDVAWVLPGATDRPLAPLLAACSAAVHVSGVAGGDGGDAGEVDVVTVPPVRGPDGERVTSERIRGHVLAGEVAAAADLLGRPFELRGVVERGDARGRTIGFPTANVAVGGQMALPGDGVYAGWYVGPDGVERPAAVNIGRRPTFYDESGLRLVEAHVLDYDGDLYGQPAAVRFVERLRDEVRFDGIDALEAQLARDVDATRQLLA